MLPRLEEAVRRLAAPEVLIGFSVDDAMLVDDEEREQREFDTPDDDGVDGGERTTRAMTSRAWPSMCGCMSGRRHSNPAQVRIVPDIAAPADATEPDAVGQLRR